MESWAVHMVHRRANIHGDEDGVGQIEREGDGKSSRRPVQREGEKLEGDEVGHTSTSAV